MGTRGVTIVKSDNKTKVAQYGQWDHYPAGQGVTILNFLRFMKKNPLRIEKFKDQLKRCKFTTKKKDAEINKFMRSIGSSDGWMTMEQSKVYNTQYPYFTRDHGAKILGLIYNSTDETIWLHNQESFIQDGLFCEYAYLIDMDNMVLEVYEGFNQNPDLIAERFKGNTDKGENGYTSPSLLYRLDFKEKLPTKREFVRTCKRNTREKLKLEPVDA